MDKVDGQTVLGLSFGYHDSAAALVAGGEVVAAAQEERFNRVKHFAELPVQAVNYCLQAAGVTVDDIDIICFYEKPYLKFHRVVMGHIAAFPFSLRHLLRTMPHWLGERLATPFVLKEQIGYEGEVLFVRHHMSHAASAFLVSPFEEAALLVSDGVGEWATMTWGTGRGTDLEILQEIRFPNSAGLLYSAITAYLGFGANSGEGKTMGLAGWGKPTLVDRLRDIAGVCDDGSLRVDTRYFDFVSGGSMVTPRFVSEFGPPRLRDDPILDRHRDMAASLQSLTEEVLLAAARHVHEQTGLDRLCLAGGSFLNCPVNTRILEETPFEEVFIQPAAGDAGGSLGAAALAYSSVLGRGRLGRLETASLGPEYSSREIERCLTLNHARFRTMDDRDLAEFVAERIAANKTVGWFRGRMEFGPRALGNRSILADPRNPGMKDFLNREIKHRESFRPYGVSILQERVGEFFEVEALESPFMLLVAQARKEKETVIPSALHADGSSRLQTVTGEDGLYRDVIEAFCMKTGVPLIINTSFNNNTEPIVCCPQDAYSCFEKIGLDYLVMENYIVEKD